MIEANTKRFKRFYQGDPLRVPVSLLPCLIATKLETRVGKLTNSEDEHGIAMRLTTIADIRQDLSTQENDAGIVEGVATLYDICEGRDPVTLELAPDSLLYILRHNMIVDSTTGLRTDLSTITRVDYGETLRERAPEKWSIEAQIEFVAHFTQNR